MIASIVALGDLSRNGIAPVKAFVQMRDGSSSTPSRLSATDLDRDPCEGKNIGFLAVRPAVGQDFWRDPSDILTALGWGLPYQIQVLGDSGKTRVSDLRMAGCVHKDA